MTTTPNAARLSRTRRLKIAGIMIVAAFAWGASAQAAQATIVEISGWQSMNEVVHYQTPRTNSYTPAHTSFQTISPGNGGGSLTLGLRNSSGTQFARAVGQMNYPVPFRGPDGSTVTQGGTFYINASMSGMCGGDGCGVSQWRASLDFNNRAIY
ncbi:hypothetical protein [Cryobacterium serini]|uniref:Uncharacterized protein n=1 Tax=Cryobacterium serini TaxID=1259201 RepID=A0A4R9BS06_9MICO|nr:hypothetical protein [Cryobacterium serini]TFD89899.1 hypothetical protein E3T51_04105 [Cryobacterium serini]